MQHFFKDENGKIVIAQWPNAPIIIWAVTMLAQLLPLPTNVLAVLNIISFGALFTWAWLELFDGVNMFRRVIGAIVLVGLVYLRLQ